jgi:hypothetical protein
MIALGTKERVPPHVIIKRVCGRATYKLTWEEIVPLCRLTLGLLAPHNFRPRFIFCPTAAVDTIASNDGTRALDRMR